ncbi:NUDIX hydrolase [Candidatus Kuenenbacteria bacterium]|nr:NUDIX hydrolase [Candidatus Kuenenbacteria bacterium]
MAKEHEKFWITQAGVIIRDNKCLVLELTKPAGFWDIPGGRVDIGEADNSEAAFRREIKEELGVEDFRIIDLVAHDIWCASEGNTPVCALIFLIDNLDTYNFQLSHEHAQYKWVSEEEIKDEFLWPGAIKMLKKAFARYRELKK